MTAYLVEKRGGKEMSYDDKTNLLAFLIKIDPLKSDFFEQADDQLFDRHDKLDLLQRTKELLDMAKSELEYEFGVEFDDPDTYPPELQKKLDAFEKGEGRKKDQKKTRSGMKRYKFGNLQKVLT